MILDPKKLFPNLNETINVPSDKRQKTFISVMQTSDVLGTADYRYIFC